MAPKSSAAAALAGRPSLAFERRLNAPPAKVYAAWTDPQKIIRWFGRADATPRLLSHSGPFVRGIYATVHAHLREPVGPAVVAGALTAFQGRPFVRVLDGPPQLTHVVGTNDALIHAATTPNGREVAVTVAIDNLVKGAGGQAVQAMNLALGLSETAGLRVAAPFPI